MLDGSSGCACTINQYLIKFDLHVFRMTKMNFMYTTERRGSSIIVTRPQRTHSFNWEHTFVENLLTTFETRETATTTK